MESTTDKSNDSFYLLINNFEQAFLVLFQVLIYLFEDCT